MKLRCYVTNYSLFVENFHIVSFLIKCLLTLYISLYLRRIFPKEPAKHPVKI